MKKLFILLCLALFGCTDSEENASTNLRKGDEFMAKGEYEIAEYYYDKIPEESVLYKTVLRRRQDIEKLARSKSSSGSSGSSGGSSVADDSDENIVIVSQKFAVQLGKLPLHTVLIRNNSSKRVNTIEVRFVYIDETRTVVARHTWLLNAYIDAGGEKEFPNISPGMVHDKFVRVEVEVVKALFF
ncbi:MAG: hypothetical protein WCW35_07095 [Bacteroidota bacterium]|jgi:hypothetical protein